MSYIRFLALAAILLVSPLPALADPPEDAPVAALDSALLTLMKSAAAGHSFAARAAALRPVILQAFDLRTILQNSVGFYWSTLPVAQQQALDQEFTEFTIASYVSQFNGDGGADFRILPDEKALGQKKIVQTMLSPGDKSKVSLDYIVAPDGDQWRITDVLLNGTISQVAVHASDFSSLVTSGDASKLIAALKTKTATLAGGAGQA